MDDDELTDGRVMVLFSMQLSQYQTRLAATCVSSARIQTDMGMERGRLQRDCRGRARVFLSQVNIKSNHTHMIYSRFSFLVSCFLFCRCRLQTFRRLKSGLARYGSHRGKLTRLPERGPLCYENRRHRV